MHYKYLKRLIDLLIGIICLPVLFLSIIIVGVSIIINDKGPIFYNSPRLGKDGKVFKMYKFRTMKVNAPDIRNSDGSTYNSVNDSRLTGIGKLLRKSSLDEVPQIINVIKGDMSIIGPRPDLPEHIKLYNSEQKKKLNVLPGITGYNQAYYRNTVSWEDRLTNDIYYVQNLSLLLDLRIFVKTVSTVLKKENIYISEAKDSERKLP